MKSLGFKLIDRGPNNAANAADWTLWWEHPCGARVAFSPKVCPTAEEVVTQAVDSGIRLALDHVHTHMDKVGRFGVEILKLRKS